jgi:hypothetical protein
MMPENENNDDDFVKYLNVKNTKKQCWSWKLCCIASTVSWFLTTVAIATTVGVLTAKEYIIIEFQNPNSIYNETDY